MGMKYCEIEVGRYIKTLTVAEFPDYQWCFANPDKFIIQGLNLINRILSLISFINDNLLHCGNKLEIIYYVVVRS
jgi:hypothetical protein